MDISAPEGPTNSFRDFFIHIVIVTIGILIALGLEGIRETIHEHHQIRETRAIFHDEVLENQKQLAKQRKALQESMRQIDDLLANLDHVNTQPGAVSAAIDKIEPGFYFFTTVSWESALSTGVLGHMAPAEANRFAVETIEVRNFAAIEDQSIQRWFDAVAFFRSHPTLTPAQLEDGRVKLQLFRLYCGSMNHLLDELSADAGKALSQKN